MKMTKTPKEYLSWHPDYRDILNKPRAIFSKTELEERVKVAVQHPDFSIKWKGVCYCLDHG